MIRHVGLLVLHGQMWRWHNLDNLSIFWYWIAVKHNDNKDSFLSQKPHTFSNNLSLIFLYKSLPDETRPLGCPSGSGSSRRTAFSNTDRRTIHYHLRIRYFWLLAVSYVECLDGIFSHLWIISLSETDLFLELDVAMKLHWGPEIKVSIITSSTDNTACCLVKMTTNVVGNVKQKINCAFVL